MLSVPFGNAREAKRLPWREGLAAKTVYYRTFRHSAKDRLAASRRARTPGPCRKISREYAGRTAPEPWKTILRSSAVEPCAPSRSEHRPLSRLSRARPVLAAVPLTAPPAVPCWPAPPAVPCWPARRRCVLPAPPAVPLAGCRRRCRVWPAPPAVPCWPARRGAVFGRLRRRCRVGGSAAVPCWPAPPAVPCWPLDGGGRADHDPDRSSGSSPSLHLATSSTMAAPPSGVGSAGVLNRTGLRVRRSATTKTPPRTREPPPGMARGRRAEVRAHRDASADSGAFGAR